MYNTSLFNAKSTSLRGGDFNVPRRMLQSNLLQTDEGVLLAVSELDAFIQGGGAVDQFLEAAVSVCNALPFVVSGKRFLSCDLGSR